MQIIQGIAELGLTILGLGILIPYLWPLAEDTIDSINAMSGGTATEILQMAWPILLIATAIGIAIAVVWHALNMLGIFKKSTYRSKK
jgi:hypothetical protein